MVERPQPISPRQAEVLDLLCEGLTNKETASRMQLSCHTVKTHLTHVMMKLGVCTRIQAAVAWIQIRPGYVRMWKITQEGALPDELPPLVLPDDPCISPSEKFWLLVIKKSNGCWDWEGPTNGGKMPCCKIQGLESLGFSARRVCYALSTGVNLPRCLSIKMNCNKLTCVNPDHMKITGLGTNPEFVRPIGRAFNAYLTTAIRERQ